MAAAGGGYLRVLAAHRHDHLLHPLRHLGFPTSLGERKPLKKRHHMSLGAKELPVSRSAWCRCGSALRREWDAKRKEYSLQRIMCSSRARLKAACRALDGAAGCQSSVQAESTSPARFGPHTTVLRLKRPARAADGGVFLLEGCIKDI